MTPLRLLKRIQSPVDGTTKYLLTLEDGNTIETVFLPERTRNTICLSSQVGCKYACAFCASASSCDVTIPPSPVVTSLRG